MRGRIMKFHRFRGMFAGISALGTRSRARAASALRHLLVACLTLLMAACATLFEPQDSSFDAATHAEQLYAHGDLEQAANEFLELARSASSDNSAHYHLRAAEALRDAGNLDAAADALGDIRRQRLYGSEPLRLDLLDAEIALNRGDPAHAHALLAMPDSSIPAALRIRALELRARAALAGGDAFASAQVRARLDRYLQDADREQNRHQLTDALASMDAHTLTAHSDALAADDPLRPWVEQTLHGKGEPLTRDPASAGTLQADANDAIQAQGYASLKHVALLLPLNAPLASVSQSIRDGFLSAWSADAAERRPEVRLYDAGRTPADAIAAYTAAVADGADHVVGPLQREAVGEIFRHSLTTRVLALNHPDTNEAPPAGSAEFGLLPDAEGTQVAQHMRERGITHASIIAADTDWAERAARAFRAQFEADGGSVAGESRLNDKDVNYAAQIREATTSLGNAADSGLFISLRPQQARLLMPQLKIARVNVAAFATSHVYSGDANATLDRDLDGLEFCDAPWLFSAVPGLPERNQIATQLASANGSGGRLFAFGMDAYRLLPYLDWLSSHTDAYVGGATGQLSADQFGRVYRLVGWASFRNGIAQPAEGALNATPLQP
jgi:outer membrane PBP1 activator LpoA protein